MSIFKTAFRGIVSLLFIGSGFYHFYGTDFYLGIMPEYMPWPRELVLLSGFTEIIAGMLFLIPQYVRYGAWLVVGQLTLFLTVHIDMIQHSDRYPDIVPSFLWGRLIIQFVLIIGVFLYTRKEKLMDGTGPDE